MLKKRLRILLAFKGKESLLEQVWNEYNSIEKGADKKLRDLMEATHTSSDSVSPLETESDEVSVASSNQDDVQG